ncbi:methanol utilization control sensor protein MoxY [Methyloglobulus morosus KoM1]|uniref:histidine kinase n=1 Tax=Methyloglobulus morosus KoM1 TaxID=1116472 RepID=V5C6N0_9GAMM|nr:histidine kinase [Methyloglobulus morosus]ESS72418.1 methanol utilization control sensor protein MoxY [Methyloglobulus morosus KoM1]
MNNGLSLRTQINIRIAIISLIILIAGGGIAVWQARISVKTELDSSLYLAAQLIQLNFPGVGKQGEVDVDAWLPRFVSLDQTRHLSIQLKRAIGNAVNFSAKTSVSRETAPPRWFVWLISAQSPIVEQHLTNADGEAVSLIIQANPIDEISEAWQESRAFFATLVLMTVIIFLAINLLFNKTIKTITLIVEGLKAIEQGNYQFKLPDFSTQEYDSIAKAINHTADVLDASYKENKALALHTLQIQEEERQHLAKELHDELGQSLTAIKVMATTTKSGKADTGAIADTIISVCDHLINVVRSMMRNLHPLVLTELGLKASLEDLLNHWSQRYPGLSLKLDCPDIVDKLEQKITIQVFRIVQECLTNIVRHSQATEAAIHLELIAGNRLKLEIADNGLGCTLTEIKNGFGLLGIRERITSLGGELTIQAAHKQGMTIKATIALGEPINVPFPLRGLG